jgi:phage protein D
MSMLPRYPSLSVVVNGQPVSGAVAVEIFSNNAYGADRFRVQIALGADPWLGAASWTTLSDLFVEIDIGLGLAPGAGSLANLMRGRTDTVQIDPVAGVVNLEGRDLTADLIEARTQETFANRTASEIAEILAARHGLSAAVAPTRTPVGRYYQLEHDRITLNQFSRATTEWDLLTFLAQHEGFDVFVQGSTLHFQPPAATADAAVPLRVRPIAGGLVNVTGVRLEHCLTLARDIEVTVKSWNSRQRTAFTQTARAARVPGVRAAGRYAGPPQRYVIVAPNLSMDDALKLAQRKLAELTRHERVVEIDMPGELSLTTRSVVVLQGTGTVFDQSYHVDEIIRRIDSETGFTQQLRVRNLAPAAQATTPADVVGAVTG